MRRAGRIMLNGMTILFLLLALAVAVAWGLSYERRDWFSYTFQRKHAWVGVDSSGGRAEFVLEQSIPDPSPLMELPRWVHVSQEPRSIYPRENAFMGISWSLGPIPDQLVPYQCAIVIPHAYLLLLFSALPAIRIYRSIRRRRRLVLAGHCRICGYDLRATPDRCPECGAVTQHFDRPAALTTTSSNSASATKMGNSLEIQRGRESFSRQAKPRIGIPFAHAGAA